MFKTITCPQCVHKLGRLATGSECILRCSKCKRYWQIQVDENGGIHALPFKKSKTKRK